MRLGEALRERVARVRARAYAAAALPVVVLLLIFGVSLVPVDRQEPLLGLAVVVAAVIAVGLRLPPDARPRWVRLRAAIGRRLVVWVIAGVGIVAVLYALRDEVRALGPGDTWAGLTFVAGIQLMWLGYGLWVARVALGRGWLGRRGAVAAVVAIAVWPRLTVEVLQELPMAPPWLILPVFVAAPIAAVVIGLVTAAWRRWARPITVRLHRTTVAGAVRSAARTSVGAATTGFGARPDEVAGENPTAVFHGWMAVFATVAAVASGALLLLAALRVPVERSTLETTAIGMRGSEVRAPANITRAIDAYSPVLRLGSPDALIAVDARELLPRAEFGDGPEGCPTPGDPATERGTRWFAPCREIEIPPGRDPTFTRPEGDASRTGVSASGRVRRVGATFARVWTRPYGCGTGAVCRVIDYWLFYPRNRWQARTAVGELVQTHGGDWERVSVGLGSDLRPLMVAYSSHCSGAWRRWADAPTVAVDGDEIVLGGSRLQATHPLAVVAVGSQANYPTAGRREPEWAPCIDGLGWADGGARQLSFAAGAYEATPELGPFQIPNVVSPADSRPVLWAPWWWGKDERVDLSGLTLTRGERGPASPRFQDGWHDPLAQFLDDWHCDGPDAVCDAARTRLRTPAGS